MEFSDLLPAGVGGLERAIDRFDAAKGFKFSTYAHWWIRQAVSRCVQVCGLPTRHVLSLYAFVCLLAIQWRTPACAARSLTLHLLMHVLTPLQDQSRVVRLPVNVYELLSKINKVSTRLNAQPNRQKPATYSEIGAHPPAAHHQRVFQHPPPACSDRPTAPSLSE